MPNAPTQLKAWPDRVTLCRHRTMTPKCLLPVAVLLVGLGWRVLAASTDTAGLLDQAVTTIGEEYRNTVNT